MAPGAQVTRKTREMIRGCGSRHFVGALKHRGAALKVPHARGRHQRPRRRDLGLLRDGAEAKSVLDVMSDMDDPTAPALCNRPKRRPSANARFGVLRPSRGWPPPRSMCSETPRTHRAKQVAPRASRSDRGRLPRARVDSCRAASVRPRRDQSRTCPPPDAVRQNSCRNMDRGLHPGAPHLSGESGFRTGEIGFSRADRSGTSGIDAAMAGTSYSQPSLQKGTQRRFRRKRREDHLHP
jgi:hypothetical protein